MEGEITLMRICKNGIKIKNKLYVITNITFTYTEGEAIDFLYPNKIINPDNAQKF